MYYLQSSHFNVHQIVCLQYSLLNANLQKTQIQNKSTNLHKNHHRIKIAKTTK